ncbi:hypothetical protein DFH08DRAFT_688781, partial [Mycena albidolilacea]
EDDQSNRPTVPAGIAGQAEVIKKCTDLVQDFRDKKFSKAVACTKIMQAIPTAFVEGGAGERAAHSCFEILDQIEKELAEAAARGSGGARRSESPQGGNGGRRHSRSTSPHDESNPKRRRINDALLHWVVEDIIVEATLSPELVQTRKQLIEYSRDPKYVLGTILNSTRHMSFPKSEWLAIIKGQAIDLNKVITGQFSIAHERQHVESIGDGIQLLFGSSTPTKTVSMQSEWITAWTKVAEATAFVFPHRRRELEVYRQYVMDLFTSSANFVHERIILLDRKLRNEAVGRRDLELSDCTRFGHWERSFLNDNGAAYLESKPKVKDTSKRGGGSNSGGGGDSQKKSAEPCRRFNDEHCPSNKATCCYAHVCSRCKRNHPLPKCDRPAAVPE